MTKPTITREESVQAIFDLKVGYRLEFADIEILKRVARMALAAMDSEPFAYIIQDKYERERGVEGHLSRSHVSKYVSQEDINEHEITCTPLYRHAQPAPEYPETLPCPVLLEPGLRFGKGIKTSTMLAALARRAVHESDMAALSPEERAEFQARIEDFKAIIAQPAPVVPEEKPIPNTLSMYAVDAVAAIAEVKGWNACRAAMLQAGNHPAQSDFCPAQNHVSPEQNGDTPAQSQGWIQVSEQMPPSRHEVLVGRWWGEKPRWCCKWATYIPGHPDAQSSGWLLPGASWTPTHWMPLPAAPQEVK